MEVQQRPQIRKLGELLKEARASKTWSARELSEQVGIHHTTITMLERGAIDQPRPDKLTKLARVLELDPTDLLTLAGYQASDNLPAFGVYLRATTALPDQAIDELRGHFEFLRDKYGISDAGPAIGEDETEDTNETK